jgi:hypothetical protein
MFFVPADEREAGQSEVIQSEVYEATHPQMIEGN